MRNWYFPYDFGAFSALPARLRRWLGGGEGEFLAGVHDAVRVERALHLAHHGDGGAEFGVRVITADDADAVLAAGGAAVLQREIVDCLGEQFRALDLLRYMVDDDRAVHVAAADVTVE